MPLRHSPECTEGEEAEENTEKVIVGQRKFDMIVGSLEYKYKMSGIGVPSYRREERHAKSTV